MKIISPHEAEEYRITGVQFHGGVCVVHLNSDQCFGFVDSTGVKGKAVSALEDSMLTAHDKLMLGIMSRTQYEALLAAQARHADKLTDPSELANDNLNRFFSLTLEQQREILKFAKP